MCSAGASGGQEGLSPLIKSAPLARGLARHNKRFTTDEIIKIVATRCQILRLKCTKSFVTALPRNYSWILWGLLLRGSGRRGEGREERGGKGRKRERGREGRGRGGRGQGRPPK